MITAKILNSAATLNNFIEIGTLGFAPESETTLVIRLWDQQLNLRRVPPATAIITGFFNNQDLSVLPKVFTPLTDDRSILSITFTEVETLDLVGGSFKIQEDSLGNGSVILLGYVNAGLTRNILNGC